MIDLQQFEGISLAEMEAVKLLNRVDSKYIFHKNTLPEILKELSPYYSVLEINQKRTHSYESLYFDTDDYQLYYQHHNGKPNRLKVRYRRYSDTGLVFFEVKKKISNSRTIKYREERVSLNKQLQSIDYQLFNSFLQTSERLQDQLWIYFDRITLVRKDLAERLTLDLNLVFQKGNARKFNNGLVVAEIKQDKGSVFSPVVQSFRKRHIAQSNFSKYSVGIATLEKVKTNSFKPVLLKLGKIIQEPDTPTC
ncbi:polyphosphate polymerase domain-containing protein [Emticicia sp. 17c]|uniref:polyphosphate polymerase domain-containing protein n=1 Tax=Emticicia sp. 17c TaxID=3127704 RepID=UPI00301D4B83